MEFVSPRTLDDALAAKAAHPGAMPIMGGTDVMVELNFDRHRPDVLLDLGRVAELADWSLDDGRVRLGAGVTYARVIRELGAELPGLAMASRTVGSPQIRNRGTVGGNLGAASPAGDSHPPLLAAGAVVELSSVSGVRYLPVAEFYLGVKRHAAADTELVTAVLVPRATGPEQFCKIGTRNAMVIAVAALGLALRPDTRSIGTGIGSAAPTPFRACDAEEFLAGALDADGLWDRPSPLPQALVAEFGARIAAAAAPIDDVRGTAPYRRHALAVLARRALTWAWDEYAAAGGR
ncbi:MAG TPA: FAD binding domain-containing protein [Nocardioidaceae bacterium]|nr:FAD binding domain-containing protein [Nocardioidaceae bacterium]